MAPTSKSKRVAIYLRVSTDEQTIDNQRRELEAVAARHEWSVVDVSRMPVYRASRAATNARDSMPC